MENKQTELKNLRKHLSECLEKENEYLIEIERLKYLLKDCESGVVNRRYKRSLECTNTYHIGKAFVDAVKKPGSNTILLPYKLWKIVKNHTGSLG